MPPPVRLAAAALAALLAGPSPASAQQQESGDRINFSRPTDKVNRVEQRPRLDTGRRAADFAPSTPSGDGIPAASPASPALTRAQVEALRKLQAERDWALQDLMPADDPGAAGPAQDGGRLSIDDLFNRQRPANSPGRNNTPHDNAAGASQPGVPARGAAGPASEFSPRARSILDGGTIFDQRPKTPDSLFGRTAGEQQDSSGLSTAGRTPAERRSEQRILNFREMLQSSVFEPAGTRPDDATGLAGGAPGLNPQLGPSGAARTGSLGLPDEPQASRTREDGFPGGGVAPTRPNFSAFSGLGAEAGGLDARSRALPELEPRGTPTVPVPKFEIPRPKF